MRWARRVLVVREMKVAGTNYYGDVGIGGKGI
jgi:hypothetical protein